MMRALILIGFIALLGAGCVGTTPAGPTVPATTNPDTTSSTETTLPCPEAGEDVCPLDNEPTGSSGTATVQIGDTEYAFEISRCLVAEDVFVIDGATPDGATTVAMRHASPPTRPDPQPSMSYLLIEPEPATSFAPAAIVFDIYDPETGTATGNVDQQATFSVACDR